MKFIPTKKLTTSTLLPSLARLERDLHLRAHYAGAALDEEEIEYNPKMYIRSKWNLPHWTMPKELSARLLNFEAAMTATFQQKRARPNLLWHQ